MRRLALASLFSLALSSTLWAQLDNYNPYAPVVEEPPIAEDGSLNWPPFFKSASMEARFQGYFQTGSCVGTKKSIVDMLQANKVDINGLPQVSVSGTAVKVLPGMVSVIDETGKTVMIVAHPKGVSRINVSGAISPAVIRAGVALRFTGKVDAHGRGAAPLESVEIVTLNDQIRPLAVEADRVQTIVGRVAKRHGNLLQVKVEAGKLKSLTIMLSPEAKAIVNGSALDVLSLGDNVTAKGHVYSGQGSAADRTIFADDLIATKPVATAAH